MEGHLEDKYFEKKSTVIQSQEKDLEFVSN